MHVVADIETNGLLNPDKIWCIVCKDVDTGEVYTFKNVVDDEEERRRYLRFDANVTRYIGHNWLGFDYPVLSRLLGLPMETAVERSIDTLVISKLLDYSRPNGHSLEEYGKELGLEKKEFSNFSKYSEEMVDYCKRDVEVTHKIYLKYLKYIEDPLWSSSIKTEHSFQLVVNDLSSNGFYFNSTRASKLLEISNSLLSSLDADILKAFPPKLKPVREVHPKVTKHGTLSKADFRFVADGDLSVYNGGPFTRCVWTPFNPSSPKQIVSILNDAGWSPIDKTKTHIDVERDLNRLKYQHNRSTQLDLELQELYSKYDQLKVYGWKINENNLATLPEDAPPAARLLAKRILLESRRRTLTEWLSLVTEDNRIHGKFFGIGAWTHRMAHQNPNTANIPNEFDTQGNKKLFGKEMRALWTSPRNRLLVGVDAEGIQLRIFAHLINEPEFTEALVNGKKEDKSDPHSLNQRILGDACKSRAAAKRFIYALLLGAGLPKLADILGASRNETESALNRLMERYTGWAKLKEEVFPTDARRGWFTGLDRRRIRIPGSTEGTRKHLCMSGYLQAGEAVVMKLATLKFYPELEGLNSKLVNFVHDEWQTETPNNMEIAIKVAKLQADALRIVGEELKLNCPLAGSYWNDDLRDYTIGTNWSVTH